MKYMVLLAIVITYVTCLMHADLTERERVVSEISPRIRETLAENSWEVTVEQHANYRGNVEIDSMISGVRSYSILAEPPNLLAVFPKEDPESFGGVFVRPWIWSNGENLILRIVAGRDGQRMDVFQKGNSPDSFIQLLDEDVWESYPALRAAVGGGVSTVVSLLHPEQMLKRLVRSEFHGTERVDGVECYVFQDVFRFEIEEESTLAPLPVKFFLAVEEPHLLIRMTATIGETETTDKFVDWKIGSSHRKAQFEPGRSIEYSREVGSIVDSLQSFLFQ